GCETPCSRPGPQSPVAGKGGRPCRWREKPAEVVARTSLRTLPAMTAPAEHEYSQLPWSRFQPRPARLKSRRAGLPDYRPHLGDLCAADTIYLKNGRRILADRVRQDASHVE